MKVTVEETGKCSRKLSIALDAGKVQETYDEIVKTYARNASIPGFRKGKAPANMVRKRFANDIDEYVKQQLIPDAYEQALESENLTAVSVLKVEPVEFTPPDHLYFEVECEIVPDFELPDYKGIKVEAQSVDVADEDVEQTINRLREQQASFNDVDDREARENDLACIDYTGSIDGTPLKERSEESAGLAEGEEFWIPVEPGLDFIPGLPEQLTGMSIGDKSEFDAAYPEDHPNPGVAGQTVHYEVELKGLREKELPAIDEEFLKGFEVETEQEFRDRIRENLQQSKEREEQQRRRNEIVKYLLENTAFDVPESQVREETRGTIHDMVRGMSQYGMSEEDIQQRKEEIFNRAEQNATEKVRSRYILQRIAKAEEIEVGRGEINQTVATMAASNQVTPDQMRKQLEEREMMDEVISGIRGNKALDYLVEQANFS